MLRQPFLRRSQDAVLSGRFSHCLALLLATCSFLSSAYAADYRSVRDPVPARTVPEEQAPIAFYYGPGTPVELIQVRNGWAQVRDKDGGGLFWIPADALTTQRTVITRHGETEVRSAPDQSAALLSVLPANAVLRLDTTQHTPPGWVAVETAQGTGYVAKTDVWGW
ncbi:SH3 domain-containing protein [Hydrogenophilus thiooxidans]|uniref:SH3 domain-containing protein n=1 Tax=Hydrogenophilus thiooxidans TaxID=2820326 RepID=UPI001C24E2FA|nr:SH3 domain-containing protein [Hydrogenophilus thiooxidans]